jgi:hypothetical protein
LEFENLKMPGCLTLPSPKGEGSKSVKLKSSPFGEDLGEAPYDSHFQIAKSSN